MMKKIIVIIYILILSGCWIVKPDDDCFTDLSLSYSVTITPAQDTFRIGDTLWVEHTVPDTFIDFKSNIKYTTEGYNTPMVIIFEETFSPYPLSAPQYFKTIASIGSIETVLLGNTPWLFKARYDSTTTPKTFRVGFIAEKAGLFILIPNLDRIDLDSINLDKKCIDVFRKGRVTTNGGQGNIALFQGMGAIPYGEEEFRNGGTFAFRVIE
jgi:hypothetical protein